MREVALIPPEDAWQPEVIPEKITVTVKITPNIVEREFSDLPIKVSLPPNYDIQGEIKISPELVSLRLSGWEESISILKRSDLRAFAEAPQLKPGVTNTIPINIWLPLATEATRAELEPATVEIYLQAPPEPPPITTPSHPVTITMTNGVNQIRPATNSVIDL